jgi:hypothetical protein
LIPSFLIVLYYNADQSKKVEINGACNIGKGHAKSGASEMRDGEEIDGTSLP